MNDQTFDYEQYAKMPLVMRKTMLKMIDLLASNEGNAAYMMVYEHDPDPELRELARQALEKNGIKVGETDRPMEGNPGETHYQVPAPSSDSKSKSIALDGGDGQVKTPAQMAEVTNLFILDKNERGFISGRSSHPSRRPIYTSGLFLLGWTAVTIFVFRQFSRTGSGSFTLMFLAIFGIGEAVAVLFFVRAFQRERLFETQGKLLQGQLIDARGRRVTHRERNNDGTTTTRQSYDVTVSYTFRTPSGQKLTSSSTRTRNDLEHEALPETGTPVAVLYVDDKTFMLM